MLTHLWDEIGRVQSQIDDLFGDGASRTSFPALNAWAGENDLLLTAELPGVEPGDLDISAEEDRFTLRGARKSPAQDGNEVYHRRERGFGTFERTVELPFRVDADKAEARFENGVLRLTLPRAAEEKPRKIAVKAA